MIPQASTRVPFVVDNVGKCMCPKCPVQAKSECVAGLKGGLDKVLKRNPLKHEEIPSVYCGAGKATCPDLDFSKKCICGGCEVFARYKLASGKPVVYYCRDGASI